MLLGWPVILNLEHERSILCKKLKKIISAALRPPIFNLSHFLTKIYLSLTAKGSQETKFFWAPSVFHIECLKIEFYFIPLVIIHHMRTVVIYAVSDMSAIQIAVNKRLERASLIVSVYFNNLKQNISWYSSLSANDDEKKATWHVTVALRLAYLLWAQGILSAFRLRFLK